MLKKLCLVLCVMMVLLSCSALADAVKGTEMKVSNCDNYITLRFDPSTSAMEEAKLPLGAKVIYLDAAENGFAHVGTAFGAGYVLEKYLTTISAPNGKAIGGGLSKTQRYNINLFLSNFTETGMGWGTGYFNLNDEPEMINFAINHIWFNQQDKLEWFPERDDYNVRLNARYIAAVTEKFFGVSPMNYQTKWDALAEDNFYYWMETGGHTTEGFAQETKVLNAGNGYYDVWFETHGSGDVWDNDCCSMTLEQARAAYKDGFSRTGYARIYASDLSDRSTFKLVSLCW